MRLSSKSFFVAATVLISTTVSHAQTLGFEEFGDVEIFAGFGAFNTNDALSLELDGTSFTFGGGIDLDTGVSIWIESQTGVASITDSGTTVDLDTNFLEIAAGYRVVETSLIEIQPFGGFGAYGATITQGGFRLNSSESGVLGGISAKVSPPGVPLILHGRYTLQDYLNDIPAFGDYFDIGGTIDLPIPNVDVAGRVNYRRFDTTATLITVGVAVRISD
jgi:hypothetical protein